MADLGPGAEHVRTRNGIAIRTAYGWVWLCDHCHQTASVRGMADAGVDPQRWADSVDLFHWCAHKDEGVR